jgi:hypothetical protein
MCGIVALTDKLKKENISDIHLFYDICKLFLHKPIKIEISLAKKKMTAKNGSNIMNIYDN